MSYKADAKPAGDLTGDIPDGLKPLRRRLIAWAFSLVNGNLPGIPAIEILSPLYRSASTAPPLPLRLYRSAPFALAKVTGTVR
jgi:hypothetical protein